MALCVHATATMPLTWEPIVTAVAVAVPPFTFGMCLVFYRTKYVSAHPLVRCAAAGLLVSVAFLVLLPMAVLDMQARGGNTKAISIVVPLTCFLTSAVVAYFIDHVVLEHVHPPSRGELFVDEAEPKQTEPMQAAALNEEKGRARRANSTRRPWFTPPCPSPDCSDCPPVQSPNQPGQRTERTKLLMPPEGYSAEVWFWMRIASVALRVLAWFAHGMMDGFALGSAPNVFMLATIALPILLCALMDIGALLIALTNAGVSSPILLGGSVAAFSLSMPCGAAAEVWLRDMDSGSAIPYISSLTAGVLAYVAMMEIMPPHTHGRLANLKYVCAFCLGALVAYLSELLEDLLTQHTT